MTTTLAQPVFVPAPSSLASAAMKPWLRDPQPDVSGIEVPAGFAAGTMTVQQAVDAATPGSILNLAVDRTDDVGSTVIIDKALTIVFGVPGGPQLTITKPETTSTCAIAMLSDDVKLYRPRLRGIGINVGDIPPIITGSEGGAIAFGGSWKNGVQRCEVVNADISDCRMDGIYMSGATSAVTSEHNRIAACLIEKCGRNGVTGGGGEEAVDLPKSGDWQLVRSRITNTNLAGYDPGESAACAKWLWLYSALVEDCEFGYSPTARGFWTDTMVTNLIFRRNRVHGTMSGVFLESSHYLTVYDNVVWENARDAGWGWGGGITLASSDHAEVYNNVVAWCGSGFTASSQDRADTRIPTYGGTVEINVHDNVFIGPDVYGTGWVQDWAGNLFDVGSNNRGSVNRYWGIGATSFAWNDSEMDLTAANATPIEEGGTVLSDAEKDAILRIHRVPAAPV